MRIAQISPLHERVPRRLYGGTERIVSFLTEELVRQGHEVTLFASGDSETSANLVRCCDIALRLDPSISDPSLYHIIMLEKVRQRIDQFDVLHFHIDFLHAPLTFSPEMKSNSILLFSASARNSLSCARAANAWRRMATLSAGTPGGAIIGRAAVFWLKCNSRTWRSASFLMKSSADGRFPSSGSLWSAPCMSNVTFLSRNHSGRNALMLDQDQSAMPCTSPLSVAKAICAVLL